MSTETTKSNSPSYSYCTEVTDPSRFLVDLPLLQEETEDLIESNSTTQQNFISGGSSLPPPSSTSTRTRRMSSPRGSTVSPLPNGNSTIMSNSGSSFPLFHFFFLGVIFNSHRFSEPPAIIQQVKEEVISHTVGLIEQEQVEEC
ncbi:hypothetical protein JCM5353_008326 [Sporobolomyces roseus]